MTAVTLGSTATMLFSPPSIPLSLTLRTTLATKNDWVWLKFGAETLTNITTLSGPTMVGHVAGLLNDLKVLNPNVKLGVYVYGIAWPDSVSPGFDFLADADLLHNPVGGLAAGIQNPPSERKKLINFSRAATRKKLANKWLQWMLKYRIDGIFFDSDDAIFANGYVSNPVYFNLPNGAIEGPTNTNEWWSTYLNMWTTELKEKLNKHNKEVWVNGLLAYDTFDVTDPTILVRGRGGTGLLNVSNGCIAEHVHRMYKDTAQFLEYLNIFDVVNEQSGFAFPFFQPDMFLATHSNGSGGSTVAYTKGTALQRYYFGCYLLMKGPNTHLGYSDNLYRAYNNSNVAEIFTTVDFDLNVGTATSGWQVNSAGTTPVYWRPFVLASGKHVYVVVNPHSTSPGTFNNVTISSKDWHPTTGTAISISGASSNNIPALTARLLFEQ